MIIAHEPFGDTTELSSNPLTAFVVAQPVQLAHLYAQNAFFLSDLALARSIQQF